ncbi:hypothetical protein ACFVJM_28150 [Streptomyces virginiae]|uniref:hypothetical protein n=1 Tax=Streptomyces virginiae TaxID=1961 RepID=UPI00363B0965
MRLPNVNGVGVSHKIIDGQRTDTVGVVVYVDRKEPSTNLSTLQRVPKELSIYEESVVTDVVESAIPFTCQFDFAKYRPVPGGCMIEGSLGMGTAGGVFYDRRASNAPVLLTNNHVLTGQTLHKPPDNPTVLQPWGAFSADQIGNVGRIVPMDLAPLGANYAYECAVDAAIVSLLPGIQPQLSILEIAGKQPFNALPPFLGQRVLRRGITTRLQSGTVETIGLEAIGGNPGGKRIRMGVGNTLFSIRSDPGQKAAQSGDSGSLVVDNAAARGLVCLTDSQLGGLTYACDLLTVLGLIDISTACAVGRHAMAEAAVKSAFGKADPDLINEHARKFDRFLAAYFGEESEGRLSGTLGELLENELGRAMAHAELTDDDFAGLLNRTIGPWLVQPSAFEMLEYRLPAEFEINLLRAFERLGQLDPEVVDSRWLKEAFANSEGQSMREVLNRRVGLPEATSE